MTEVVYLVDYYYTNTYDRAGVGGTTPIHKEYILKDPGYWKLLNSVCIPTFSMYILLDRYLENVDRGKLVIILKIIHHTTN